ncbi:MAG: Holliday junction DNA helicase RuvB C-terminal domain-containing protein, partial [Acidobacteriota bacterium]|nr:Holliday junction DNA helicase RuvB C-terminal domain-containing protein [Acidobacteriota bacterium]
RARGTPRIANRLLRRVRDFAEVKSDGKISASLARQALDQMEVDLLGLDEVDRKILMTIMENFNGGPVGINTIAAAIDEERETIESIYEPYLMRLGFLERTLRGRKLTSKAYDHLGFKPPDDQKKLF